MEALTSVLLGGTLKRGSWIYRFLSFWLSKERIEEIEDSCQLRSALLFVEFWMLFAAFCFALVFRLLTIPAAENLFAPLPLLLGTSQFFLAINFLVGGYYALGALVRPLGLGRFIKNVFGSLLVIFLIIGIPSTLIFLLSVVGGIVNEALGLGFVDFYRGLPAVNLPLPGGYLEVTGMVVFGILGAVVVFVIAAFFYGSWQFFRHFQSWAAKTHFWEWLKGRLCRKIVIED